MPEKQFAVTHSDAEWRQILTPDQYDVMRAHGTEAPGSCALLLEKRPGRFSCAGCGQPLFESRGKFESGTGWPSFNDPIEGAVETSIDRTLGMVRTEVDAHDEGVSPMWASSVSTAAVAAGWRPSWTRTTPLRGTGQVTSTSC